jgi:hypothetical protein
MADVVSKLAHYKLATGVLSFLVVVLIGLVIYLWVAPIFNDDTYYCNRD